MSLVIHVSSVKFCYLPLCWFLFCLFFCFFFSIIIIFVALCDIIVKFYLSVLLYFFSASSLWWVHCLPPYQYRLFLHSHRRLFLCLFPLICLLLTAYFIKDHSGDWEPALRMYRGMFLVIFDLFLLGVNTYGWRSSGVNHVLIFEIDPRNHLSHAKFMEVSELLIYMCFILLSHALWSGIQVPRPLRFESPEKFSL